MDLDSSLDDIIKHKKQKKVTVTTTKKVISKHSEKTKKIKSTISKTNINSRLGGGGFVKNTNNNQGNKRADPSQIIITKNVPFSNQQQQQPRGRNDITSRLSFGNNQSNQPPILSRISAAPKTPSVTDRLGSGNNNNNNIKIEKRPTSITIRGTSRASNNNSSSGGFSIRGESGPSTVLLSNLDAHITADDVKVSCGVFGKITSCDVLRDRNGLSYGEAEIKFSTKTAALDCIAKLDNEYADGRLIRAILRDPKPPKTISYASKQIRSTLAHASGKMYADQMQNPRYDVHR
ncbi:hypothetical protein K501DRAFT_287714 [Backusella circina FSU 941]|nr:hypothetical protein K501DRAFT_287714 [Backusella circina FSU 941]